MDHRGHLLRIGLELGQIAAVLATVVSVAKTGFGPRAAVLLAISLLLTVALLRTPRPPLPENRDDR